MAERAQMVWWLGIEPVREREDVSQPMTLAQGRYEIDQIFADSGGMGVIYDARDTRCMNNRVLIKTTRYDGGTNSRHFAYDAGEAEKHIAKLRGILEWEKKILIRFKKEGLNNIPSIIDFFYDRSILLKPSYEGRRGSYTLADEVLYTEPYLVMECVPGDTLESIMRDPAFQERREVRLLHMAKELLTIFIRLHRTFEISGNTGYFIYQDLKPANILVSTGDYFTLIDMGGVTLKLGDKTTEPTAGMLTYGYAAPEGEDDGGVRIDHRFDLYTLGATLYHALTGVDPRELPGEFPELSPQPLRDAGVSREMFEILRRALERDPEKRYGIAAEMRKDVVHALRAFGEVV